MKSAERLALLLTPASTPASYEITFGKWRLAPVVGSAARIEFPLIC